MKFLSFLHYSANKQQTVRTLDTRWTTIVPDHTSHSTEFSIKNWWHKFAAYHNYFLALRCGVVSIQIVSLDNKYQILQKGNLEDFPPIWAVVCTISLLTIFWLNNIPTIRTTQRSQAKFHKNCLKLPPLWITFKKVCRPWCYDTLFLPWTNWLVLVQNYQSMLV